MEYGAEEEGKKSKIPREGSGRSSGLYRRYGRPTRDTTTAITDRDDDADLDFGNFAISHLDCDTAVHVSVSFCRNDESLGFDSLRVHIEVTGIDRVATRLPEIVGDDIIRIDLPLSSNGMTENSIEFWNATDTDLVDKASDMFQRHWGRISGDSNHWQPSATKWLSECHQNHQCKTAGPFYPTRLIDVNDPSLPRLVKSEDLGKTEQHPYTTLSYVWGTVQKYVLTTANLSDLQTGVDPSLLPKTINDAVHVSRQRCFSQTWGAWVTGAPPAGSMLFCISGSPTISSLSPLPKRYSQHFQPVG